MGLRLGIALGMAKEFLIQQTSLAPLAGIDAARTLGRWHGVNWGWLLLMLPCNWWNRPILIDGTNCGSAGKDSFTPRACSLSAP